jgi:hypothetical protein
MRAAFNLYQHLADKHGLSGDDIETVLKEVATEKENPEELRCPECGRENLRLKIKCTIAADLRGAEVKGWWVNRVFYTTLACRDCQEAGSVETRFYDFEDLPGSVISGIFNTRG